MGIDVQGRSGSVAFPRTKVAPASPAREVVGAAARSAERNAEERRRVEFIFAIDGMVQLRFLCFVYGQ
jgi:hypothetical protein